MVTQAKISSKKRLNKEAEFEELTTEEEKAIEEGRKAYIDGDWKTLKQVKNALGIAHSRVRAKKS